MKKRIISIIIAITMIITGFSTVIVTSMEDKWIAFPSQGITDEQLAEMVTNGKIPHNVKWLSLFDNQISDLTPLSELTNLETLSLVDNQISDLTPLSELTNLETLSLVGNQISDLTPLSKLTNLQSLDLYTNKVTDITPLSNLTNLGGEFNPLNLSNNQITDISPLSNLTKLQWLSLDNNQITDLTPMYNKVAFANQIRRNTNKESERTLKLKSAELVKSQRRVAELDSIINDTIIIMINNTILESNPPKKLMLLLISKSRPITKTIMP
jgi:Leucine-rich repeat (LRR) protein